MNTYVLPSHYVSDTVSPIVFASTKLYLGEMSSTCFKISKPVFSPNGAKEATNALTQPMAG